MRCLTKSVNIESVRLLSQILRQLKEGLNNLNKNRNFLDEINRDGSRLNFY